MAQDLLLSLLEEMQKAKGLENTQKSSP